MRHQRHRAPVLGAQIDAVAWPQTLALIAHWAQQRESRVVCFCNAHSVVTTGRDMRFANAIQQADLALPDGAPVAWLMRRTGHPEQARISGPDVMWHCLEDAARCGCSVYFLGSRAATLEALCQTLAVKLPTLHIAGTESPPFRAITEAENSAIAERIHASGASLVFVGLGCPKQELWMDSQRGHIPAVMLGVGAAFDFHAGRFQRAPSWMRGMGLEWLHRLLTEPRRLAGRYIHTNSVFIVGAIRQLFRRS